MLEYDNDPTKAMRDQEQKISDPKASQSVSQLVNNGYVA